MTKTSKTTSTKPVNGALSVSEVLHKSADNNFDVCRLADGRIAYVFKHDRALGLSKSGKSTMISTTSGALNLPGLPTISVNVFRK